jgi:hypothetical protein
MYIALVGIGLCAAMAIFALRRAARRGFPSRPVNPVSADASFDLALSDSPTPTPDSLPLGHVAHPPPPGYVPSPPTHGMTHRTQPTRRPPTMSIPRSIRFLTITSIRRQTSDITIDEASKWYNYDRSGPAEPYCC